uniref:Tripartite motif containing 25, like n=1 Tax=Sinocyclocheilus anshuiensis TaxID=1608454 RepID=A0A671K447_9TELE
MKAGKTAPTAARNAGRPSTLVPLSAGTPCWPKPWSSSAEGPSDPLGESPSRAPGAPHLPRRSKGASKKLPGSAVPCDRCPEPKAAVKTCLVCMASFCETHLKPHNTQDMPKNHELIAPTGDLSQKICPEHKYLQEFFCRSCQMYVCWLCTSNQHKGHESTSTQAERNEKQRMLELLQDVMCHFNVLLKCVHFIFQNSIIFFQICKFSYFLTACFFCLTFSSFFFIVREINIDSIQAPEPRTKDEFLQYACDLTLDPNTAHRRLVLSDGDTVATLQQTSRLYLDLPQRFDGWTQVLCLHPLSSDRCYWEVEWRGRGSYLGVVSGSIPRKGANSRAGLGYNSQSWSLELSDMCCAAMHGNQKVEIPVTYSPRVGVFLDRTAGTLTFYSVDDELVPLHTFQWDTEVEFACFIIKKSNNTRLTQGSDS